MLTALFSSTLFIAHRVAIWLTISMVAIRDKIARSRTTHLVLMTLLAFATILKESQRFYTNLGGWPICIRQGIRYGYYPAYAIMCIWFLLLALNGAKEYRQATNAHTSLQRFVLWCVLNVLVFCGLSAYVIIY